MMEKGAGLKFKNPWYILVDAHLIWYERESDISIENASILSISLYGVIIKSMN